MITIIFFCIVSCHFQRATNHLRIVSGPYACLLLMKLMLKCHLNLHFKKLFKRPKIDQEPPKYSENLISPLQAFSLQLLISMGVSFLHCSTRYFGAEMSLRDRSWLPCPHVLEQDVQLPKDDHLQETPAGKNVFFVKSGFKIIP